MTRRTATLVGLCVLLRAAHVVGEEATAELAVTATRTRTEDVATSFTVVDRQEIEQRGQDFTSDALRSVPGMDIIDFGSPGQASFAFIRGSAPDQVLVLLLTLRGNYTYLNAVTPTGVLFNRPRHRGSFVATAMWPDLLKGGDRASGTVLVYAVGSRESPDPQDEFEPAHIGGYARVDLALQYRLAGRRAPLTLTATVRNLFNRDYSESIGFPAPPARFLMGFRYELG